MRSNKQIPLPVEPPEQSAHLPPVVEAELVVLVAELLLHLIDPPRVEEGLDDEAP